MVRKYPKVWASRQSIYPHCTPPPDLGALRFIGMYSHIVALSCFIMQLAHNGAKWVMQRTMAGVFLHTAQLPILNFFETGTASAWVPPPLGADFRVLAAAYIPAVERNRPKLKSMPPSVTMAMSRFCSPPPLPIPKPATSAASPITTMAALKR